MDAIVVEGLTKTFTDAKKVIKAVDSVSFSVRTGEIFGLLGANGAGKTTIISILMGLLSRDTGNVRVLDMNIDHDMRKIKQRMSIISGFTMVSVLLSAEEYLRYYSMLYSADAKRIYELAGLLKIEDKLHVPVKDLSSGYKQRLLLAKALICKPDVILMDEPTVGLDVSIAVHIRKLIKELKKKGTTILFTSHNLSEVEELCDRVALLNQWIIQTGTIDEIKSRFKDERVIEVIASDIAKMKSAIEKLDHVKAVKAEGGKLLVHALQSSHVNRLIKEIAGLGGIISIRKLDPSLEHAVLNMMGESDASH